MAQKHKIGVHVSAQQRDGYGVAAPHLVSVVTFDPGAFDEIPDQAIKIFRTHAVHNHKDVAGDFDRLPDSDLEGAAEFWWGILRRQYEPIRAQYGEDVYFQPINEINNPRTIPYLRGMVRAAEKDGYRLALWGDAGGSPDLPDWIETWMPFMKEVQAGGHIYSRHAYSGVSLEFGDGNRTTYLTKPDGTPTDSNTGRPFIEAELMQKNGIYMPMVITELGWLGGWNNLPHDWMEDILRYNELMMAHQNIVGSCLWNAGNWENAPNILAGRPLIGLGNQLATMEPQFFVPGSITVPDPEPIDQLQSGPRPDDTPGTATGGGSDLSDSSTTADAGTVPAAVPAPTPVAEPQPDPEPADRPAVVDPSVDDRAKEYLVVERFRDLEWYDWQLPNGGGRSNMQVPIKFEVNNITGDNPFSDGKPWNEFGLAEASYLTTGHNLSIHEKDKYTEYESLATPGGYVVYKLFSTHAFNATYSAEIDVTAGRTYRLETRFYADFAHYRNPQNGDHKKVTDRMDPRHGLVRVWADGYELPHQQLEYLAKQTVAVDFVATQTGRITAHWQFMSNYAMSPTDGVAGYFITEISAAELETEVGQPEAPAPVHEPVADPINESPWTATPEEPVDQHQAFIPIVTNSGPDVDAGEAEPTSFVPQADPAPDSGPSGRPAAPVIRHKAIIIKVGQEESAAGAARLMERYAFDRRRSLTFSTDDMLTLLRGGTDESVVEIYRPELPSNQGAIEQLTAAGYAWREIKLDWGR